MTLRLPRPATALAAALALSLTLPVALTAGAAGAATCQAQIDRTLRDLAVPQSEVKSVKVVKRSGGARSASNYRLDAWVELSSCSDGHLVINMTRHCLVQKSYTTGSCSLPGLSAY
ncbi:hypothetical protein [Pelagibius marinus]|uniref:hypothetical protein n=1 Tax=Pelagibius marinus TaxID=2762760 RepID=UPI0018725B6A|nr:hypothetical protein [Pelagibius marinus]